MRGEKEERNVAKRKKKEEEHTDNTENIEEPYFSNEALSEQDIERFIKGLPYQERKTKKETNGNQALSQTEETRGTRDNYTQKGGQ